MIDSAFNYGTTPFNTTSSTNNNNNSHNNLQINNNSNNNNKLDVNQRNNNNNNNNNNSNNNSSSNNNNMIIENQVKAPSLDYKHVLPSSELSATAVSPTAATVAPPPLPVTNNSLSTSLPYQHNQSSLYKLNILSPCRSIQTIHQPHQYPPQPSSTGSVSPNSNLSSSASPPTVFPSPTAYSSATTSLTKSDLTNSTSGSSAPGYSWNTYAGLSTRPQFPYAQYATDYYGSMTSAAAGWFSQDRLYPTAWSAAAAATPYGFPNLDDIAFQTQLQRRSIRCTCPNCTNEMSGLPPIVGPDERGRKQHICHIPGCERLYGKASHLKTHLRWHTGERPFLCLTCGKRFSRSDELQRHGRTHTNYRPYSCPICAKKFSRSDHLSKHKKTHFKDKKSKKSNTTSNTTEKEQQQNASISVKKEIEPIKPLNRVTEECAKKLNNLENQPQNQPALQNPSQINGNSSTIINNGLTTQPINNTTNYLKQEPTSPPLQQQHYNHQITESASGYAPYSMYSTLNSNLHHPQPTSYTHPQSMSLFYSRSSEQSIGTSSLNSNNSNNQNNINHNVIQNNSDEEIEAKMNFTSTPANHLHYSFQQNYPTSNLNQTTETNQNVSSFAPYDHLHSTTTPTSNYPTSMTQYQIGSRSNGISAGTNPTSNIPPTSSYSGSHSSTLDYSASYPDFTQNSMMSGYHHHHHPHWANYHHHPQMN